MDLTRKEQVSRPIMMWVSSGIGVGPRLTSDMSFSVCQNERYVLESKLGYQLYLMKTHIYIHIYMHTDKINIHIYIYVPVYIFLYIHTHIYMYAYVFIYTHTYKYTYIHI